MELNIPVHDGVIHLQLNRPHPVIFEIGAHHMEDTLRIKPPECDYYAFEPDPRNIQIIHQNKLPTRYGVQFFPVAIGDKNDFVEFSLSDGIGDRQGWSFSSSMRPPKLHLQMHPWCTFNAKTLVSCTTLDTFCQKHGIDFIDFVWMDVQGCEDLVFAGGVETLKHTKYIFTEYANEELYEGEKNLQTLHAMLGSGWKIAQLFPTDVLFVRDQTRTDNG